MDKTRHCTREIYKFLASTFHLKRIFSDQRSKMSNLTMKNSSNYCFTNVDSRNVFKEASVGFVLTTGLVIVSALCFIIWFEKFGSDKKRTLINKLAALLCWNLIYM